MIVHVNKIIDEKYDHEIVYKKCTDHYIAGHLKLCKTTDT